MESDTLTVQCTYFSRLQDLDRSDTGNNNNRKSDFKHFETTDKHGKENKCDGRSHCNGEAKSKSDIRVGDDDVNFPISCARNDASRTVNSLAINLCSCQIDFQTDSVNYSKSTDNERNEPNMDKESIQNISSNTVMSHTDIVENAFTNPSFEYDVEIEIRQGVMLENNGPKQSPKSNKTVDTDTDTSNVGSETQGVYKRCIKRLYYDGEFREKVFRTFSVLANYTFFGWTYGIIGPTLPDLQLISDASLQEASWLFAAFNIGYLVSCGLSGFANKKLNSDILIFLYTALHVLSMVALPWIPSIYGMAAARGVTGYCCGGQDIELTAMLFSIWHDKSGPIVVMAHFVYGVGGILSPLVAEPFLIKTQPQTTRTNIQNANISVAEWQSNCSSWTERDELMENALTSMNCTSTFTSGVKYTNVHFAYLIGAVLAALTAMPFIIFYFKGSQKEAGQNSETEKPAKVSGKLRIVVVALISIAHFAGMAIVDEYPIFLTTFGMLQLDWSQAKGSSMTAVYFAMYAVGNLLGVFLLRYISSRSYVYLTYVLVIGSIALFYAGVHWTISLLQTIPVALIGIATSSIMPTLFTWTQESVTPVSGFVASALFFSGSIGGLLNPILLAFLIESVTPLWLIYLSVVKALFCFVICIIADTLIRTFNSYS